jgi:hypothetical protein
VLWLTVYPCTLLTFAALARPWLRKSGMTPALDATMLVLVTAAVVTAATLPALSVNQGNISVGAQLVTLAYPVGDSVLLSVALIGAAVAGWRAGAVWRLLAIGSVMLVGGDILWTLQTAAGTWQPVMSSNAVYPLWPGLAAVAAWLPRRQARIAPGSAIDAQRADRRAARNHHPQGHLKEPGRALCEQRSNAAGTASLPGRIAREGGTGPTEPQAWPRNRGCASRWVMTVTN